MNSTGNQAVLLLLILGVAAWAGAVLAIQVRASRGRAREDHIDALRLARADRRATRAFALPGALVVLAAGAWLLRDTDLALTEDWWTAACLGLWIVAFAGSTLLRAPECSNIIKHGGDDPTSLDDEASEDIRWRMRRVLLLERGELLLIAVGIALAITANTTSAVAATTSTPSFRLRALAPTFTAPVWVGGAPGDTSGTLYVVEQGGTVWKVRGARKTRFLDLRRIVASGGEQGLLSIAFAADFRTSGRLYTYFTLPNGNGQVRQYRVRGGAVVSGSGKVIINVPLTPPTATNHNGGQLWAMPGGQLLLSTGDGGGAGDPENNAQRLDRLTGKLLRISPRLRGGYTVPSSNPYRTRAGARREIYALGLRNPWRFSVDAPTGDIWVGDVGQGAREEIDVLRAGRPLGANFGWKRFEGNVAFDEGTRLTPGTPYVKPRLTYGRSGGACSVTGGVVYRGPVTALRGHYLYADFCTSTISTLHRSTGRRGTRPAVGGIVHFGAAGPRGDVYVASNSTGKVYRIAG
jgi:glucose/arabinose dehydrogenase